ncbi:hypothetical protein GGS26DRAFT_590729 [Hypomontagnella submonticulosa]|nr:hypothetical protein GGS26DRAFT_590729 [Hypomontagnella submonticulosa]
MSSTANPPSTESTPNSNEGTMIAAALIEAGQYDPGPSPPDEVLSSYTYGIPFIKLDNHPVPKTLAVVDPNHPFVSLFNSNGSLLRPAVLGLAMSHHNTFSLTAFRLGYGPEDQLPNVLIVYVTPDKVSWEQGSRLAYAMKRLLHQFGIDDVHCEVFEATTDDVDESAPSDSADTNGPMTSDPPENPLPSTETIHIGDAVEEVTEMPH